jgi:hypothetical protein
MRPIPQQHRILQALNDVGPRGRLAALRPASRCQSSISALLCSQLSRRAAALCPASRQTRPPFLRLCLRLGAGQRAALLAPHASHRFCRRPDAGSRGWALDKRLLACRPQRPSASRCSRPEDWFQPVSKQRPPFCWFGLSRAVCNRRCHNNRRPRTLIHASLGCLVGPLPKAFGATPRTSSDKHVSSALPESVTVSNSVLLAWDSQTPARAWWAPAEHARPSAVWCQQALYTLRCSAAPHNPCALH